MQRNYVRKMVWYGRMIDRVDGRIITVSEVLFEAWPGSCVCNSKFGVNY